MKAQHQPERVIIIVVIMYDNIIGMPVTMVLVTMIMNVTTVVVVPTNIAVLVTTVFVMLVMTTIIMRLAMTTMMTLATVMLLIHLVSTMTTVLISQRNRRCQYQAHRQQSNQRQCFQSG